MTLYKIINVSPIQQHPYQTRYGGTEQTKMQTRFTGRLFQKAKSDAGN
jgi:hypothetical protein